MFPRPAPRLDLSRRSPCEGLALQVDYPTWFPSLSNLVPILASATSQGRLKRFPMTSLNLQQRQRSARWMLGFGALALLVLFVLDYTGALRPRSSQPPAPKDPSVAGRGLPPAEVRGHASAVMGPAEATGLLTQRLDVDQEELGQLRIELNGLRPPGLMELEFRDAFSGAPLLPKRSIRAANSENFLLPRRPMQAHLIWDGESVAQRPVPELGSSEAVLTLEWPAYTQDWQMAAIHGYVSLQSVELAAVSPAEMEIRLYRGSTGAAPGKLAVSRLASIVPGSSFVGEPQDPHRWYFTSTRLKVGAYFLELRPLGLSLAVELLPGGTFVPIDLPPLAHVRLRFLAPDGQAMEPHSARISAAVNNGLPPRWMSPKPSGPTTLEAWVVPGELLITPGVAGFYPDQLSMEVVSGTQDLDIQLQQVQAITLNAGSPDAPLALPLSWWDQLRLEPLSDATQCGGIEFELFQPGGIQSASIKLSAPGLFRIELPEMPGEWAASSRVLHLDAGEAPAVYLELKLAVGSQKGAPSAPPQ